MATSDYTCEECEEYLVIEAPKQEKEPDSSDKTAEPVVQKEEGATEDVYKSIDSGYVGKQSRACSPEAKETKAQIISKLEADGWDVLEVEKKRPAGLFGYRYIDYDDSEAEGNIHITDNDL